VSRIAPIHRRPSLLSLAGLRHARGHFDAIRTTRKIVQDYRWHVTAELLHCCNDASPQTDSPSLGSRMHLEKFEVECGSSLGGPVLCLCRDHQFLAQSLLACSIYLFESCFGRSEVGPEQFHSLLGPRGTSKGATRRVGCLRPEPFCDHLKTIRDSCANDVISHEGNSVKFQNVPRPLQSPRPPIWIGGTSDAALRRASAFWRWLAPRAVPIDWLTTPPFRLLYHRCFGNNSSFLLDV